MGHVANSAAATTANSSSFLRRRSFISTTQKLHHFNSLNESHFELLSSYTSLKDLLPPATSQPLLCLSPRSDSGSHAKSCCDIAIRNPLVKQAALAYLQPMAPSPGSSPRRGLDCRFLHRAWHRLSGGLRSPFNAYIGFLHRGLILTISQTLDRLLTVFSAFRRVGLR